MFFGLRFFSDLTNVYLSVKYYVFSACIFMCEDKVSSLRIFFVLFEENRQADDEKSFSKE